MLRRFSSAAALPFCSFSSSHSALLLLANALSRNATSLAACSTSPPPPPPRCSSPGDMPIDFYTMGLHRVRADVPENPRGCLPQGAYSLDARPQLLHDTETLLDVTHLELDATSMRQIRQSCGNDEQRVCEEIKKIVATRGKMHNPVTRSGGVCIGIVREIGKSAPQRGGGGGGDGGVSVGTKVVPLCSMSAFAMQLDRVLSTEGNQVQVDGKAVVFGRMHLAPLSSEFDQRVALGAIDGSRLLPQVRQLFDEAAAAGKVIRSVAVLGCGASGQAALALVKELLVKQKKMNNGEATHAATEQQQQQQFKVVGFDASPSAVEWAQRVLSDEGDARMAAGQEHGSSSISTGAFLMDACSAVDAMRIRADVFGGVGADLVLNCVSVPGTEAPTTLLCAEGGTIVYFSMATTFAPLVLSTDPVGCTVRVLAGAGVFSTQHTEAFALLRGNHALLRSFLLHRGVHDFVPDARRGFAASHMLRFAPGEFKTLQQERRWRTAPFEWYAGLHRWSIADLGRFWSRVWDYTGIVGDKGAEPFYVPPPTTASNKSNTLTTTLADARFFPGASVNHAENLLRHCKSKAAQVALVGYTELDAAAPRREMTFGELERSVARAAAMLRDTYGVRRGDRVVGLLPNVVESVVLFLATTSLGAVWTAIAPDAGAQIAVARLAAVRPKVLIAVRAYNYNGKTHSCEASVAAVAAEAQCPTLYVRHVVVVNNNNNRDDNNGDSESWFAEKQDGGDSSTTTPPLTFERTGFHDPFLILFTSGTTGKPKALAQNAGVLLNHCKEQLLHLNLGDNGDADTGNGSSTSTTALVYTNTGWMVWSWAASLLALGSKLVLYDGAPFPAGRPLQLWEIAAAEQVTYFGAGARVYEHSLTALRAHENKELTAALRQSLRLVSSTGSVLPDAIARRVMREWLPGVKMVSLSGGTELNGCLCIAAAPLPVTGAELQCAPLGMDVDVVVEEPAASESSPTTGQSCRRVRDELGELVCMNPFPSMPSYFFGDENGERYRASYFGSAFGSLVWAHADLAVRNASNGSFVIKGRSDATLNPGGVRVGSADYYEAMKGMSASVADSIVVDVDGVGVVMFYVPANNNDDATASAAVVKQIRELIRRELTPKHVPVVIAPVHGTQQLPYNRNLKKMEVLVKKICNGEPRTAWAAMLPQLVSEASIEPFVRWRAELELQRSSRQGNAK